MIATKNYFALLPLLGIALAGAAAPTQAERLTVETVGEISYVSGGVGTQEQEALQQAKSDFNLHLLFAVAESGAFLARVPISIADESGQVLVEAVSDGPYFYAKVPTGTYTVSAENSGNVQTRTLTVPASGTVSEDFRWPAAQ